ncbi:TonB-dependent receptor [Phenylobacterium sp.]|uniref:TonB-dependent receptor n=1 Tax=Phenylobacterium sp. TaxID=1871053 RepID=UPI0019A8A85F|nr:TonB-dependent receptor [Phenylobacterium sp.]MBC7167679.1 TonB-dependent receptor [Phenylobacterium sp.]
MKRSNIGIRATLLLSSSAVALAVIAGPAMAQSADDEVSELVVVGYRAQNAQAIEEKREDARVAEYLSADDIGAQPDYNIADALRRLPGVQTQFDEDEGRYVSIRGLNPSYTLGAMDGATLATAERQNRQLNMEAIPSGAVRQVVVAKSRTPDMDGNAIGGTLNLITRSAFDVSDFYAAGTAMIGTSDSQSVPGEGFNRDTDDGLNYRLDATVSKRFGAEGQFGVLFGVNFMERNRDQERLLPQTVPAGISATPTPVATLGTTDLLWSNYPNTITRYGGILKLEWEPMADLRTALTLAHYKQDDNELRHSQRLRNQTGGNASFVRFNDFPLEKPLTVVQWKANWDLDDNQSLEARASYSEATFLEPSNQLQFNLTGPALAFDLALNDDGVPVASNIDPRAFNPANYALANNTFSPYEDDSDEYVQEFGIDYGFNIGPGDRGWGFGLGAKWREITRDNDRTTWSWTYTGAPLTLDQFDVAHGYTPIYADFNQLFIDFDAFNTFFEQNRASFTGGRNEAVTSDWVFEEQVGALYALARHAGERHSVIFGGRFEDTQTTVERARTEGANVTRVTRDGSYDDFLPSITLTYDLTDRLKLRAAAFQAIGRPNPSQLASGETVNQTTGAISRGNPDLQARKGDSYEASLEYYLPGDQGLFAVGVFRKEIENEIITRLTPGAGPNGEDVTQPVNVTTAEVNGLELNAVVNSLPLPGLLSNFGISANATFLDGSFDTGGTRGTVDMLQGQSDFLFNLALFYEQGPFRARASYARIGEATTSVSSTDATGVSDRIDEATDTVDMQARYTLSNGVELIAEVRNVTDENKVNTTGDGVYRDVSFYGRQFWIGASAKF